MHHMAKSMRTTITFSAEHDSALNYLSEKLGKSRSAIISDIMDESIPQLFYMVKKAEDTIQKGDTVEAEKIALINSFQSMINFLEKNE